MADLARQFGTLERPTDAGSDLRFSAAPVEGYPNHRIAMDWRGLPSLLIGVSDRDITGPPLVLEHFRMQQGVECRVTEPTGATEAHRFSIIRCTDDDPATCEYFLRVGGAVVDTLGDEPTSAKVGATIERLVELFRALAAPPRKSVIGFWAELFMIYRSGDVPVLVQAWHASPEERFDFAMAGERLEVKAALGRTRHHHFALEQLLPLPGVNVLIASVLVERSGTGPSVSELLDGIRNAVRQDAAQLLHVDTVMALTLGAAWRNAMDERFDAQLASSTLTFFEPRVIPKPADTVPAAVTEVRFVSDLEGCPSVSVDTVDPGSGLLAAAMGGR
jgi:Putative  PD-(D/E)XK family member, (DUF4420)